MIILQIKNKFRKNNILLAILVVAFLIRLFPLDFPIFTSDEARIASRGCKLSMYGTDELGRRLPLIFNSLTDYQLPSVSYLTAVGCLFLGKSDIGVRMPFILIGTALVYLVYKLSKIFFKDRGLSYYVSLVVCFSPGLIFFSKFSNEFIVSAFLVILLLLVLSQEKANKTIFVLVCLLLLLTYKIFFFILIPFVILSLILNKRIVGREKLFIFSISLFMNFLAIYLFLNIPQGTRSLVENNFTIINDISIKNAVERLRSQMPDNWPAILDRILFNKTHTLIAGIFGWLSHFQLSYFFAQLDTSGKYGFLNLGAFPKITIIPFLIGVLTLIQKRNKIFTYLILFIICLSFPLFFLYPNIRPEYIIITLPFFAIIISKGLINLNKKITFLILTIAILEFLINLFYVHSSIKNANFDRPFWIKQIVSDGFKLSLEDNVGISDSLVADIVPFIGWYTDIGGDAGFENVVYPYKIQQSEISNINIIRSGDTFYYCGLDRPMHIISSRADLSKILKELNIISEEIVKKVYKDSLTNEAAYLLEPTICVRKS